MPGGPMPGSPTNRNACAKEGIAATLSMTNLYIETVAEFIQVPRIIGILNRLGKTKTPVRVPILCGGFSFGDNMLTFSL